MSVRLWAIMVLLVVVSTTDIFLSPGSATSLTSVPIIFVNRILLGNFTVAKGLVLSHADGFWSGLVQSVCKCRVLCRSHTECVAFSTEPQSSKVFCRMAKKGPLNSTLQKKESGNYTFWTKSIPHILYRMEEDGFLYVIPDFKKKWENAKNLCQRIPGHRLGMYHAISSYNTIMKLHTEIDGNIWADLVPESGKAKWGDGVYWEDSEVSSVATVTIDEGIGDQDNAIRIHQSKFDDLARSKTRRFACQANPNGKDW